MFFSFWNSVFCGFGFWWVALLSYGVTLDSEVFAAHVGLACMACLNSIVADCN